MSFIEAVKSAPVHRRAQLARSLSVRAYHLESGLVFFLFPDKTYILFRGNKIVNNELRIV